MKNLVRFGLMMMMTVSFFTFGCTGGKDPSKDPNFNPQTSKNPSSIKMGPGAPAIPADAGGETSE